MKKSGKDRLKCAVYESTLSTAARSPFPNGEGSETRMPLSSTQRLSQWGMQRGGGFAAKKKANPASLRSAAPSKGRGSHGYSLLPMEGGAPKGRRLDGESGIPDGQSLPRVGKAYDTRMPLSPYCHFERKREIFFARGQAKDVRIAASGKHRAPSESEGRCFMQTALRKKTETGNEKDPSAALGMTKRGNASFHSFSTCCGSQPRLAALGSPFQGKGLAWILPPSYGRRCPEGAEVGWGKRYPRHKAFPAWGRWRAKRAG